MSRQYSSYHNLPHNSTNNEEEEAEDQYPDMNQYPTQYYYPGTQGQGAVQYPEGYMQNLMGQGVPAAPQQTQQWMYQPNMAPHGYAPAPSQAGAMPTGYYPPGVGHVMNPYVTQPGSQIVPPRPQSPTNQYGVQFGSPESSANAGIWRCTFEGCDRTFNRQDRLIGHIHQHQDRRDYACNGICGDPTCSASFHSKEQLTAHRKKESAQCEACHNWIRKKNMGRHRKAHCPALYGSVADPE